MNFDILKNSLKHEIDFASKTQELRNKLEKLRSKIESSGVKVRSEANEQRLQKITAELSSVSKELDSKKSKLDAIGAEFQAIKESRKKRYNEGIKVINESLIEFCRLAYDGQVIASLEVTDKSEPYLHDVIFNWRTCENPVNNLNEVNRDCAAALALLLGVTKLKKQQFVVLASATQDISFDLREFFRSQTSLQVVLLSSKTSDDQVNYLIRKQGSSFAFTRIN